MLAREGRRVLLVDMDPQGHCALGLAVPQEQIDLSILDCLLSQQKGQPTELSRVVWQITPNLDLAPSRVDLSRMELTHATQAGMEKLLARVLDNVTGQYDYTIIDCPPHVGLLTRNALRAATDVIIPVDTGYFALHGLTQQLQTIRDINHVSNKNRTIRVLANQYDIRTKLAREILAELRKKFGEVMFESIVNFNTKLKEGASYGQPITEFAPSSMGARDFQKLARELMADDKVVTPTEAMLEHAERMAAEAEKLLATTATLVGPGDPLDPPATSRPTTPATPVTPVASAPAATPPPGAIHPKPRTTSPAAAPDAPTTRTPTSRPSAQPPVRASEPTHEETQRRIDRIYGVTQTSEGVLFRASGDGVSEVQVAGDFNDWMPHTTPMHRNGTDFEALIKLPPGRYRYRLVMDGRWSHDSANPDMETNQYGEWNSILHVGGDQP